MKTFLKAILAGFVIGIGAVVYLNLENRIVGSILFSLGLFTIYTFELKLFTGKLCYIFYEKPRYLLTVFSIYMGNFIGASCSGYLYRVTRVSSLTAHTLELVNYKLSDTLLSTFIMAVMCGILMSIAVIGFDTIKDNLGKYIALFLPIMIFILSGYEHSIANIFYFSFAGAWSAKSVLYLLVITAGNLVGGNLLPLSNKYLKETKSC